MKITYTSLLEAESAFDRLYRECRDSCLWFWHSASAPANASARSEALRQIQEHGTLRQFTVARELKKWL